MTRILENYLHRNLWQMMLLLFVLFIGLSFFIAFLGELNDLGHGEYHLPQALLFVTLHLPTVIYRLFPVMGLLGALLALGHLHENRELVALQCVGLSIRKITFLSLKNFLMVSMITMLFFETCGPWLESLANTKKNIALSGVAAMHTASGIWLRENDLFIHIDEIINPHELKGILVFKTNGTQLTDIYQAQNAKRINHQWQIYNGQETNLTHTPTALTFHQRLWDVDLHPRLLKLGERSASQMNLLELFKFSLYQSRNHLMDQPYWLAFWQRLLQPCYAVAMMLLAIPFIFGPLRQATSSFRLFIGVMVGLVFYLLNQFIGPITTVYQISPLLTALSPLALFFVIAKFLPYSILDKSC